MNNKRYEIKVRLSSAEYEVLNYWVKFVKQERGQAYSREEYIRDVVFADAHQVLFPIELAGFVDTMHSISSNLFLIAQLSNDLTDDEKKDLKNTCELVRKTCRNLDITCRGLAKGGNQNNG